MHEEKKDFMFDKRASSYDDGFEGKLSKKFYTSLLKQVKLTQEMNVLDVGCGTGMLLRKMADRCEIKGYGIDVEENMIAEAKKKCPEMNIQISKSEAMPFDSETFDVLTACMAYHHFSDKEGFAKEAARVLKSGGSLYIADPRFPYVVRKTINAVLHHRNITGKFFTPQEIHNDFAAYGFEAASLLINGYVQVVELKKA